MDRLATPAPFSAMEPVNPAASTVKILVADDSAVERMILSALLKRSGYSVVLAENGQEAVARFEADAPDLVFMDVIMPELNGMEAARKIRELSGDVFTPIIFLTSLVDTESLVNCLDSGGDDFLSKPYNPVIIEAKIKSFYRMRAMNQTMIRQRDQIEQHNKHLLQEQRIAKQVFDKVTFAGTLDLPMVRHYMSALAVFNGDVLLADLSPTGSLLMVLGDLPDMACLPRLAPCRSHPFFMVWRARGSVLAILFGKLTASSIKRYRWVCFAAPQPLTLIFKSDAP